MLSDELESKPELLVQFVQNTAIPLGQGLVESEPKDIACLSLLPVTDTSECSRLLLPDDGADQTSSSKEIPPSAVLRSVQVSVGANGEETRAGPPQKPPGLLSGPDPPGLLQDLQPGDSTSFILLNLTRAGLGSSAEHLVFVQDEAEDSGNDFLSGESADGSPPWFLRVQELAHDSLIAATRAQLARNAKAGGNGESVHLGPGEGQPKESAPVPHLPRVEKRLKCTVEGCDRTFVWPAHFKYHLKTHRLREELLRAAEAEGAHAHAQRREALHLPGTGLRQAVHHGRQPQEPPADSHGREALPVRGRGMRALLRRVLQPPEAPGGPFRSEAPPVPSVRKDVFPERQPERPREETPLADGAVRGPRSRADRRAPPGQQPAGGRGPRQEPRARRPPARPRRGAPATPGRRPHPDGGGGGAGRRVFPLPPPDPGRGPAAAASPGDPGDRETGVRGLCLTALLKPDPRG
ncbi:zinc finger protein 410 isoform X4 [Ornithorhynchus anatinus]|uniref:zinc finger protein 410 isoform X4 n=1 Tax=Ornithorhynchus anatinus TaxID=9258 RepID=UPI0010A86920|nr:zinc finger protein 410 isoform X4 [Ornithorhynchus anatinus]